MNKGEVTNHNGSDSEQSKDNLSVKAPDLSLPKGGGAIRGIGEKFAANPVTGTGSMSIPIATSPGRSGFGPELSLSYDSGSGNGLFGLGWNLALPSITRKTDKGLPKYLDANESDEFILSGAEDLVPVLVLNQEGDWEQEAVPPRTVDGVTYNIQRYRPRIEGLFARIERWTNSSNPEDSFWRSISKENITTWYGKTKQSRITAPTDPTHIFSWLICESYDDKGNVISYEYTPEDSNGINRFQANERNRNSNSRSAQRYLKRIKYGNTKPYFPTINATPPSDWMFEIVFDYGEHNKKAPKPDDSGTWPVRQDPFSNYRAGFEVRTYRLCQRVLMFHHFPDEAEVGKNCLVRSTDFNYHHQQSPTDPRNPIHTVIDSVTQCSYQKKADNSYSKKTLPPVEFGYSPVIWGDKINTIASDSAENLPAGVDGSQYQWLDLDGEGLSGVLTEQGGAWFYKHNESPVTRVIDDEKPKYNAQLSATQVVKTMPAGGLTGTSNRQFLDLAGNGQIDLVEFSPPLSGFYERTDPIAEAEKQGWSTFQAFKSIPNINWNDPNLKFIDLTGDGHADILITENEVFTWYLSLAEQGFAQSERVPIPTDEEQGPRVIFADLAQTMFQADLSGDGLTDIVRIRNGEVCYWPNLGYGRFGAKVTMDNAPHFDNPDQFHPNRLRLTDIDGSGTIDIIYLGRNKTQFWFNQSGNGWSEPHILEGFPPVDNIASVAAVDLLGNGTACLVWSSPLPGESHAPMRYIELMAAGKPHLLINTTNNLGAETQIQYTPSTYFYLKDKQAGKPWITKLPFPVHVVEKVTVTDKWNKTTFSSTYSYHHGYFDGHEREFRGFGRVEQIDAESYGEFTQDNISSHFITNDHTLYQPPIKTVTWYHTGAMIDREEILSQFKHEYFPQWLEDKNPTIENILGTFQEAELPEPDIKQQNLDAEETREAMRACKDMVLRQEVYELDVDELTRGNHHPVKLFSTAYHNCHIQRLQARSTNPHAVFLVTESEAITYQYELDLQTDTLTPDPRIAHSFNLNTDEYGNVLQAVAVVYPRLGKHQDDTLEAQTIQLIQDVQKETHIAYSENHFTNDINTPDNYRLRLPCEALSYELTGISPADEYFTLEELQSFRLKMDYQSTGQVVTDIEYHQLANRTSPQKRKVEHNKILYFDDKDRASPDFLSNPLPFKEQGNLGLPYETYTLALTESLLDAVLAEKLTPAIQADLSDASKSGYINGIVVGGTAEQYWIRSGIAGFAEDAADHFFLPERYIDAFNQTTTINYDPLDLYIQSSTDPVGNTVSVEKFDYRVLAPRELKDINDNVTEVIFDVLGLPTAMAIKGKQPQGEWQGDNLDDFSNNELLLNPAQSDVVTFCTSPTQNNTQARQWLGSATTRFIYHFGETLDAEGNEIWGTRMSGACSITREQHKNQTTPLQIALECSDGSGNVLMQKAQAEPDPESGNPRWIINGLTVLNNKGNPVKQYEPAFTERFGCEMPQENGVTSIIYYDATSRAVRTEFPDGSYSRVEISPWHVTNYDQNDTVLEPANDWYKRRTNSAHPRFDDFNTDEHRRAATLVEVHANTPSRVFLDSLGREVISVAHNRHKNEADELIDEYYTTFSKLDAEGKPLWIEDARGNLVMRYTVPASAGADPTIDYYPAYDIAGNLLFQHSMDAGDRWMINDASGQPFYAWDLNERASADGNPAIPEKRIYRTHYDELRRPLNNELKINAGAWQTIERFVYGEAIADTNDAQARNLRGQLLHHYDQSGVISTQNIDFKGNLLQATRKLTSNIKAEVIDWPAEPDDSYFEPDTFTQNTQYDALNRMVWQQNWRIERPLLPDYSPPTYLPQYNQRGVLKSEEIIVNGEQTPAITNIVYDVKGQRQQLVLGNGTVTNYEYDSQTYRLLQLSTTKAGKVFQDLHYTYDAVGNITDIRDDAQQTVYFNNSVVEPEFKYIYDALYRLIQAQGREHATQNNTQRDNTSFKDIDQIPFDNSPNALQNYTETYQYDEVGNILNFRHQGHGTGVSGWNRFYQYALDSNRLLATNRPGDNVSAITHYANTADAQLSVPYRYDTHGSMLNLERTGSEFDLHWDYRDMIHHVTLEAGGNSHAFYNYDSQKQRTRKRIEKNRDNIIEERFYLGGMELYRRTKNGVRVEEIETYHLFATDDRVLTVENVLETDNVDLDAGVLFRYQYSNHLGSVGLELNADAEVISYEEYHPYGTTAYSAKNSAVKAVAKRYKYTGMERDEETGLSYHTARYYLPWLGRWGSSDPIGVEGGLNAYRYCSCRPSNLSDPEGEEGIELGYSWSGRNPTRRNWDGPNEATARDQLHKLQDALRAIAEVQADHLGLREEARAAYVNSEAESLSLLEIDGRYTLDVDLDRAARDRGSHGTSWILERLKELSVSSSTTVVAYGDILNMGSTLPYTDVAQIGDEESRDFLAVSSYVEVRVRTGSVRGGLRNDLDIGMTILHELVLHAWRDVSFIQSSNPYTTSGHSDTSGHTARGEPLTDDSRDVRETHYLLDIEAELLNYYYFLAKGIDLDELADRSSDEGGNPTVRRSVEFVGGPLAPRLENFQSSMFLSYMRRFSRYHQAQVSLFLRERRRTQGRQSVVRTVRSE